MCGAFYFSLLCYVFRPPCHDHAHPRPPDSLRHHDLRLHRFHHRLFALHFLCPYHQGGRILYPGKLFPVMRESAKNNLEQNRAGKEQTRMDPGTAQNKAGLQSIFSLTVP